MEANKNIIYIVNDLRTNSSHLILTAVGNA